MFVFELSNRGGVVGGHLVITHGLGVVVGQLPNVLLAFRVGFGWQAKNFQRRTQRPAACFIGCLLIGAIPRVSFVAVQGFLKLLVGDVFGCQHVD